MPVLRARSGESFEAPQQHKQPSRKGKKAWRKNVDVTELQQGLEDLNEEIIRGGVVKERDSADLFTLDTKGDTAIRKRAPKHAKKTLKADEILAQRSAVPAVSMRKRPGEKTTDGLLPAKRQRTDWVSNKELDRLKKVADGEHGTLIETRDATYDLWDAPAGNASAQETYDFIPEEVSVKAPKSSKQKPLSLAASGKQVRAVQKPSGGYSYNPLFNDYEARLAEESEKALETERKRVEAEEAERLRQEATARSAAEADAAEAKADLSEWEEDSEWEGFQSGVEDDDDKPSTKRPQRKTQAQRNRIKRRKEEERLAKHKAQMKARRAQEERIKDIAEEVSARDEARQLVLRGEHGGGDDDDSGDNSDEGEDGSKLRRRQLGKMKLPEKDLELVLPDELQESLRLLRPEGNLLKDRYRSMLVRGKLESRRHIPFKKQAKRKMTEKWTHKDFVL